MLYIPRWKIVMILGVCVLSLLYSAPNVMGPQAREWLKTLPGWMPSKTVNLGLDLQGGSHLLLEVDVDTVLRQRASDLVESIRPALRKEKIGYTRITAIPGGIRLLLTKAGDSAAAKKIIRGIDADLDVIASQDGATIEGKYTEMAVKKIQDQTISQSIEIVRRRVDETGTNEPLIQRQGENRIIVQLPGVDNPDRVKNLLGTTAKLTFHLVNEGAGHGAAGSRILPMQEDPTRTIGIQRREMLTGDMLVNAQSSFDQAGRPVVSFRLNGIGAKKFCDVTRNNVNKPFAIVLDDKVISAPNINEPICGGAAQISGNFTLQETNDLSLLLRAGALPAPLKIMEERTVGPSLGADSIEAGKLASMVAFALILIFMIVAYGTFGIFAAIALFINAALTLALLSGLQATLTLPGIAGFVLSIAMAVDSNVLIFERIREEMAQGRSALAAVDAGFNRALATIIDSNVTTLIAAIILYAFGTGPIRGFAVTLGIGIVTSFFSAILVTRLIVALWLRNRKPDVLPV